MYRDHNCTEQVFSGSKFGMLRTVDNGVVFSFAILRIGRFCNLFKARHLWNGWGRDRWTWKADAGHPLCNQVIPSFAIFNSVGNSLKRQKNHITNHDVNLSQVSQRHERQPWKDKVPCSPFYRPSSRCHKAKHQGIQLQSYRFTIWSWQTNTELKILRQRHWTERQTTPQGWNNLWVMNWLNTNRNEIFRRNWSTMCLSPTRVDLWVLVSWGRRSKR